MAPPSGESAPLVDGLSASAVEEAVEEAEEREALPVEDVSGGTTQLVANEDAGGAGGGSDWATLDLREAGRFVRNAAREAQEAAWKSTNLDARQIWGVREAQRLYAARLRRAISDLMVVRTLVAGMLQPTSPLGRYMIPTLLVRIMHFEGVGRGECSDFVSAWHRGPQLRELLDVTLVASPVAAASAVADGGSTNAKIFEGGLRICVRKRPLLDYEIKSGEWDAVEIFARDSCVLCHDGRLSRSGRQLSITHRHFAFDKVWSASAVTETVYRDAVRPLIDRVLAGQSATLLCMGQTGTGKTHTICGVVECLARDLACASGGSAGGTIAAEFFEIHGRRCCDLFAERREVHLRSDEEGRVHIRGQRTVTVPAAGSALAEAIAEALRLRASEKTERNEASSRSHAVCTLKFGGDAGVLRLVDLAGSERNFETTKMTAKQHRESAEINFSLMVLKDCFRAHAALQRGEAAMLPFRRSQLTRVLRDCFVDLSHATAVIATISPTATDVIHTVNTLNHAAMLVKPLADLVSQCTMDIPLHLKGTGSFRNIPVQEWTPEHVHAWLQEAEDGRFAHVVVPPTLDGRILLGTSAQGLSDLFEGELRRARVDQEGEAWNIQVENVGRDIGRDIFTAARRAALAHQ